MKHISRRMIASVLGFVSMLATGAPAVVFKPADPSSQPEISYRYPVLTAPRLRQPPSIDGTVEKAEWAGAAMSLPLVAMTDGKAAADPARIWIAYSDEALYVAFRFGRPTYAEAPRSRGERDAVWGDDCLELFIRPWFGRREEFNFVVNARGVTAEGRRHGGTDKTWNAPWSAAAREIEHGYEGELKIPFASLGVAPPKAGEVWELLTINSRRTPTLELATSSFLKHWNASEDFGYLVFGEENAAVVRPTDAGATSTTDAGLIVEAIGGKGGATFRIQAELWRAKGADAWFKLLETEANPLGSQAENKEAELIPAAKAVAATLAKYELVQRWDQVITVEAERSARLPWLRQVPTGDYVLHYRATDGHSRRLVVAGTLPFRQMPAFVVEVEPYLLIGKCLSVICDYRRIAAVSSDTRVVAQLLDGDGRDGRILEEMTVAANTAGRRSVLRLSSEQHLGSTRTVRARLVSADGRVLADHTQPLTIPALPEWWGNNLGKVEKIGVVPKPWTPIEAKENGFVVWGREIELANNLMPTRITHREVPMTGEPKQQMELLAGPARLILKGGGETLKIGPVRTLDHKPWVLRRAVDLSGQNLKGTLTLEIEFDGLMKYTLELNRGGEQSGQLEELVLELPRPAASSTHYNHGFVGTQPEAVKPYSYGTMRTKGLKMAFTERLWVGNDRAGIDFIAGNDRWWSPMDNPEAVQVAAGSEGTIVTRIEMVKAGQPRTVAAPIRYRWALLPTPAKPMSEYLNHELKLVQSGLNWDRTTGDINAEELKRHAAHLIANGTNAFNVWSWGYLDPEISPSLWNPDFSSPALRPDRPTYAIRRELLARSVNILHEAGMRSVIAYMLWDAPSKWPNMNGVFWREMVSHPLSPSNTGYLFAPTTAFADWYLWELERGIREIDWDGMYQDSSAHRDLDTNLFTGMGWYDDAGRLRGTYPQFENRELHKRIWVLFHQHKPNALIYSHNSHFINAVVESFIDVHHAGEGSHLVRDYMIGKWYGYPLGTPVTWTRWNNAIYKESRMRSWRVALLMDIDLKAHPNMVLATGQTPRGEQGYDRMHNGYADDAEAVWWLWQAWNRYPWKGSIFLPPWRVEPMVRTGHDDVLAALHCNKGKAAMLVVSSFIDKPFRTEVQIDWKALGLDPSRVRITDIVLDKPVAASEKGVWLDIEENRWRMLFIETTGE